MQNFNLFLNKLKHQKGKRFRSLVFAWLHRGYATRDKVLRRRFKRERREKERCHKQTNKQTNKTYKNTYLWHSRANIQHRRTNLLSRQLRAFHTRFTSNRRRGNVLCRNCTKQIEQVLNQQRRQVRSHQTDASKTL